VAAFLALLAAVFFALAAALQQRGQFALAHRGAAVEGVGGLVRLLAVPIWLLGTVVLLLGYATQGAALDRGRLVVVQPLLVTTIVWALPLGYWLTAQNVVRRQVLGAGVVVIGLALFVLVGDPDAGVDNASTESLLLAVLVVSAAVAVLLVWLRAKTSAALRAAVLGVCAGLYFGLSAGFAKPVLNDLHVSVGEASRRLAVVGAAGVRVRRLRTTAAVARDRTARAGDGGDLGHEPGSQRAARDRALRGAADASRLARRGRGRGAPGRARRRGSDHARKP
jgi:hypothetical protein